MTGMRLKARMSALLTGLTMPCGSLLNTKTGRLALRDALTSAKRIRLLVFEGIARVSNDGLRRRSAAVL